MKSNLRNEIKSYIVRSGYTMQEVVDRLSDDYGWSDSVSNLSNKLQRLNEQAARQRAADREAMLASAQKQVADLVLLTTAKVSQRTLDADADRAMLDALLEEVGDE